MNLLHASVNVNVVVWMLDGQSVASGSDVAVYPT